MNRRLTGVFILMWIWYGASAQGLPVLDKGQWYKFSVSNDGLYKIDYNLLKKAGLNPDQIDPKKIKIFAGLNSMLPQANNALANPNFFELAISVLGEQDGKFNKEDAILFYGQGSDAVSFNTSKNIFSYQNNIYSDKNYYFLTVSTQDGKRVTTNETIAGNFPVVNQFDDFNYYETDKYNILSSGREWFGEQFDSSPEIRIRFDTPGIVPNSDIKVVSHVMSQAFDPSSFKVFFNNVEIGTQNITPIPNTQYGIKGRKALDTMTFNASAVSAASASSFEIKYQYIKTGTQRSVGYLDLVSISMKRLLNWNGNQFSFMSSASLQNPTSTFNVNALPEGGRVWEITDAFNARENTLTVFSDRVSFSTSTNTLKKFIAFTDQTLLSPVFENTVANQAIVNALSSSADLIIVTHPDFKTEALRLAAHRTQHDGLVVYVATTEEIYNEYSGGKQDVTAIRNYVRSIYSLSPHFKNLLLFGRCSYDYKNRVISNTNFVPTYQSRNSLSPLETYSSDDYYGFLEATEGEWGENPAVNHTMEIGVGRLSVKKAEEAKNVVDKLIAYDLNKNAFGKWRKEILFVADDGDFNIHQSQADQMANDIEATNPQFNTTKLYLDSYKQLTRPSGQYSPDATQALNRAVNKGSLIINFTGHGSEQVWVQERILDPTSINEWNNKNQLPLFVTATCEFGRHDDPLNISTAELIFIKKNAGAIGLVTTARPVNSSTNFVLNKAFYNALFEKKNGHYNDLGTVFRDTKNQSLSGVSNRNFSLIGDPSMHLAIPEKEIVFTEISTTTNSDTLKALSNIIIKGEIQSDGSLSSGFSGVIQTTLYDKTASVMTLGDENPVFTFKAWNHILFQGSSSVTNGTFEITGQLPKATATVVGNGKLSAYAYTDTYSAQAFGANSTLKVGSSETITNIDSQGPDIELFLGDTTYRQGGAVGASTHLVATLFDKQGIDISGYNGGNIEIVLDDSIRYIANTYYETALDDYKNGTLRFPLTGLQQGTHNIQLTARDTYSNSSSASITFNVAESNTLIIDDLINYPNPFAGKTTIQFSHNRPGEDLEAQMVIYNSVGQPVNSASYSIPESLYKVTLTEWDGTSNGINLTNGIYFMKLSVRSLSDGAKNERLTKLIVLN